MKDGYIVCTAHHRDSEACLGLFKELGTKIINHHGGSISLGFVTFGSILGIEMHKEMSTGDSGSSFDPLVSGISKILGNDLSLVRAVDALNLGTRDAL